MNGIGIQKTKSFLRSILAAICLVAIIGQGCSTSPERAVVTTEQTIKASVEVTMHGWYSYVKAEQVRLAGNVPELIKLAQKEQAVREVYNKYYYALNALLSAQIAAKGTTNGVPAEVVAAVSAASAPLVSLIDQLRK